MGREDVRGIRNQNNIEARRFNLINAIHAKYEEFMDGIVEKLALSELEIAIAEGKVIEFDSKRRKKSARY